MVTAMGVQHGPHRGGDHVARARSPRRSAGRSTCSRWTRSAPGRSPSPDSGSDAFGVDEVHRAPRRRRVRPQRHRRRSSPTAPTPTRSSSSASSTRATPPERAQGADASCSTGACPGFEQSKPLRKMGLHSSPTGELFLDDVRVGRDRLIGETEDLPAGGRDGAKETFQHGAHRRGRDGARHHRGCLAAVRASTRRTGCSSASRSASSS